MDTPPQLYDFTSAIKSMHRFGDPTDKLQDLLDPSGLYPKYIRPSMSRDHRERIPLTWIYQHALCVTNGTDGIERRDMLVVCKVSTSCEGKDWLTKEAKVYEHPDIAPFLGGDLPEYYGLFQTPSNPADNVSTNVEALCLVLEYAGRHLRAEDEEGFGDQTIQFQYVICPRHDRDVVAEC